MKKAFLLVTILFVSVISTACINNFAVQELNVKAKSFLDKGDYENAINRLEASIDLDSSIFETHYNLGIAYTQAEKFNKAVEAFEDAIKLKPDFADTYYSLAVAQENYAKGIIDGSIKADEDTDSDDEDSKIKESPKTSDEMPAEIKLTKEDKDKIADLFEDSIESYNKYLEKGKDIKDKADVEQKIQYLQEQILKYDKDAVNKTEG